jgi:phospholipid/cholesterol/gamma-HCH transport system substrate-binding protein
MEKPYMETEGRYTLVGTLVLAVIALMTLAIVWLAGAADNIAYRNYLVYFEDQSLDGLAVGSPVKMRGIKVGTVDGYDFASTRDEAVTVTARIDADLALHRGAVAYIKRNLVTGIAAIEIVNGPNSEPALAAVGNETHPVIAEGRSDLDKVAVTATKLANSGGEVLDKVNSVLSKENQRALSQSLANLKTMSAQLVDDKEGLKATLASVRASADTFRVASARMQETAVRVEGSLLGLADNADVVLKQTVVAMDKLQQDASLISASIQQLSDTGTLEMARLGGEVRNSTEALTTTGQRLSEPRTILFGPAQAQLGPGEKLP